MNKKGNTSMQIVLIELNREYKSVYNYNLTRLLGLNVTIEPLRNKGFTIPVPQMPTIWARTRKL